MRTYHDRIFRFCAGLAVLGCMAVMLMSSTTNAVVLADTCTPTTPCNLHAMTTVGMSVKGEDLDADLGNLTFFGGSSITLNGSDQSLTYALPIIVDDERGTGEGWKVSMYATVFSQPHNAHSLPANASTVISTTVVCVKPGTCSAINAPHIGPLPTNPATPLVLLNATEGKGMGHFKITPKIVTTVPATAFVGNYSSTITVIVAATP